MILDDRSTSYRGRRVRFQVPKYTRWKYTVLVLPRESLVIESDFGRDLVLYENGDNGERRTLRLRGRNAKPFATV